MRWRQLTDPNRLLITECQRINFGRITVQIQGGEPDPSHPWRMKRTVKLACGENNPRPEAELVDFELSQQQSSLVETLKNISDGTKVAIDVKHGLPFLIEIEQEFQAA